jgi:hypothetical protein
MTAKTYQQVKKQTVSDTFFLLIGQCFSQKHTWHKHINVHRAKKQCVSLVLNKCDISVYMQILLLPDRDLEFMYRRWWLSGPNFCSCYTTRTHSEDSNRCVLSTGVFDFLIFDSNEKNENSGLHIRPLCNRIQHLQSLLKTFVSYSLHL